MGQEIPDTESPSTDDSAPVSLPGPPVLQVLFERAPEIITITDADGRQTMVNGAGLRLLGFDESFRMPSDGTLFVHPDDRDLLAAHRVMLSEREVQGEAFEGAPAVRYRVRAGTGEWRWLETVVADMRDVPEVGGRVAFSRDVTQSEERARALVESQARLTAIVASFSGGAFLEDGAGQILMANDRLTRLFDVDRSASELIGQPCDMLLDVLGAALVDPSTPTGHVDRIARLRAPEVVLELRSGREVGVEVIAIRDGDNDYGRLWLFHDATAWRDEERRQQTLLELEQQARQAAELHAERLQAYDKLRNDFVAGVSHELRTPLTAIASASELLLSDPELPEGARDHLDIVHRNADRLRNMVEDLLLVGRLDAGVLTLELREVRLAPLLGDAAKVFESAADRRSVAVRVEVPDDATIVTDPRRLTEIVENLVGNAVKYTARGTEVVVAAERIGDRWAVSVRDHGPGIPADQRNTVFERFVRASDAERAGTPGAGLGLAIVKGLVELHGGVVAVHDAPGGGALLRCVLPARPVGWPS